jgi:hypothetical protein
MSSPRAQGLFYEGNAQEIGKSRRWNGKWLAFGGLWSGMRPFLTCLPQKKDEDLFDSHRASRVKLC